MSPPVEPHQEGDGGIEKAGEDEGAEGDVGALPVEGEDARCHSLGGVG